MQKVISVSINCRHDLDKQPFTENEFPQVNKLLSEGYVVASVYQMAPTTTIPVMTITFVLDKPY